MTELWGILAGILLTLGTGVFVASEFALVNLDRAELEQRQARGEKRLGVTISALKITSTHLSAAQLGITLTTLLAGYTFEPAISSLISGPLASLGVPTALIAGLAVVIAVVIATLFSMIFGELIPKNFALAVPLATAKLVVPLQAAFTWFFGPVVRLLNGTANALIRRMGIEPKEELSGARSAEELSFLIRRSALEGVLDSDDAVILNRTLKFSERTAEEVMTPRVNTVTVERTDTAEDVVAASLTSGFSRFIVLGEDIDDVVGVVHVKAAFAVEIEHRGNVLVSDLMTDVQRVPESAGVENLLATLRQRGNQMAVVIDEYGGTAGTVTLEDLVEELLGEVRDEHDRPEDLITVEGDTIRIPGSLRPDELWERASIRIPENEEYETVAGYLLEELERIPEVGESLDLEYGVLTVDELDGSRIEWLRYRSFNRAEDPAFEGAHERVLDNFEHEQESK